MLASAPKIAQEASQGGGGDAGEAHHPKPNRVGDRVASRDATPPDAQKLPVD